MGGTRTTAKPLVLGPVGKCIYCSRTDDLSREHVIPKGLGGGLILLAASCPACKDKTGKVEEYVLHHMFSVLRTQEKLPKSGKRKPVSHATVRSRATRKEFEVPISELPRSIMLPVYFGAPWLTVSASPAELVAESMITIMEKAPDKLRAAIAKYGPIEIKNRVYEHQFPKMLAKIAHGLVFAHYYTEKMRPLLTSIIVDGDLSNAGQTIGQASEPLNDYPGHNFTVGTFTNSLGRHFVGAKIRLFAYLPNSPTYSIIVGEFHEPPEHFKTDGAHLKRA